MPLVHQRNLPSGSCFGIWEVLETENDLLELYPADSRERSQLNSFSHSFRRKQFLASRLLLHTLLPDAKIVYDENGKPHLEKPVHDSTREKIHVSISHTSSLIAVMTDTVPCGIDIETMRPKIEKIAPKFLSPEEMKQINDDSRMEKLHIYWCAKEAMYKFFGRKNVSLRTDIFVDTITDIFSGTVFVTLTHAENKLSRKINYEQFRNCMLAWTESPGE